MLKHWASIAVLRHVLPFTQTNSFIIKYKKKPDRYLYCNELHFIICLLLFWFEWYAEQIFMFGMYLVPISIYKFKRQRKLQLNSHRKFVNIHMRNLVKLWKFSLHLSLETVLPALKLTIYCINMRVSFLENWQFNHKLAFLVLRTYQAWRSQSDKL